MPTMASEQMFAFLSSQHPFCRIIGEQKQGNLRQDQDARMRNLALTPTPFIGRSQEIDEIGALLDDPSCRLLTLVGPGGIGKTRLAVEVASHKCDSSPDGLFFVPLAPLNRADDILTTI